VEEYASELDNVESGFRCLHSVFLIIFGTAAANHWCVLAFPTYRLWRISCRILAATGSWLPQQEVARLLSLLPYPSTLTLTSGEIGPL